MPGIGLFFDTDTGNTRKVAKLIKKLFEEDQVDAGAEGLVILFTTSIYSCHIKSTLF